MAELLHPKKRTKVEELSTITLAYIKNKCPDRLGEDQRLRVLFDSGCGATLINKKFIYSFELKEIVEKKYLDFESEVAE